MESNASKLLELTELLTEALNESDSEQVEVYFTELNEKIRSLSKKQLAAEELQFQTLNLKLIELNDLLYNRKESLKNQLSQFKVNTNKLKAYSK
jgi:hypothetical protein